MYDITDIKNYILYLKVNCGLSVTLHPIEKERLILTSELITFNIHDNPYCVYVKSFPEAQRHCIECQQKVIERCKKGSFCGACYAGVREIVYPITDGQKIMGFISVSGYRCENSESYISATSQKFFIPIKNLLDTYEALDEYVPPKKGIDTLIMPLCNMLELAYLKSDSGGKSEEGLIDGVVRYIKHHHAENITLEDVCEHFSCSRSYISHMFKKSMGQGFREYLAHIRLEDAKTLLKYSKLSVAQIAFSVGFGDSNYFSNLFKKKTGLSPMAYRKENK